MMSVLGMLYRWLRSLMEESELEQLPDETMQDYLQRILGEWDESWDQRKL